MSDDTKLNEPQGTPGSAEGDDNDNQPQPGGATKTPGSAEGDEAAVDEAAVDEAAVDEAAMDEDIAKPAAGRGT